MAKKAFADIQAANARATRGSTHPRRLNRARTLRDTRSTRAAAASAVARHNAMYGMPSYAKRPMFGWMRRR